MNKNRLAEYYLFNIHKWKNETGVDPISTASAAVKSRWGRKDTWMLKLMVYNSSWQQFVSVSCFNGFLKTAPDGGKCTDAFKAFSELVMSISEKDTIAAQGCLAHSNNKGVNVT